ncbi:MAG: N-acetylmuramoyl-L-alanine amidase [Spirochaetales bacterium]|nr:N-acetylmuramoyl-L-alanine amidase [Spirochaetales bacterium]
MLIDDWATLETNFFNARKTGSNLEEKYLGGLKVYKMVNWRTGYYHSEETTKHQIVLHYTVGPVSSALPWLTRQDYDVSVAYMIARDGTVYELFDPKYWSNHLGIPANYDDFCCKQTIAIEICNKGWLDRDGDILKNDLAPYNYCRISDSDYYYRHYEEFRGHYYYATYSQEQYKALRRLIPYLCMKFNIRHKFLPKKRINDFLSENEMKNFRGILTHTNFRTGKQDVGPAFRWEEIMGYSLPIDINTSDTAIENGSGIKPTHAALERYYHHTEIAHRGGYFPVGANTIWHGGLHIHTQATGEPVLAMAGGKLVAARLAEEDKACRHYGSNNFILLEHTFGEEKYYSLYMHLHWEPLMDSNANLITIPWLQTERTINYQKILVTDSNILSRLKKGEVCTFDDKSISTGEKIWTSGLYGSPDYRTPMIHWEIFSEHRLMGEMWTRSPVDGDNDSIIDLDSMIEMIDVKDLTTRHGDGLLTAEEIIRFYRYNNGAAKQLRYYACYFILENAIDWDTAVNELQNRGFLNWKNIGLPDRLRAYNFWDEAKSAGVELPDSPKVWHYNPVTFIELATLKCKRLRFASGMFDANRSFPKQGVCSLLSSLAAIKRENPHVKCLCLGYAGGADNSCGNKTTLSEKRAEAIGFLALNNGDGKLRWIARFDYDSNWGNFEIQTILSFLTKPDGSGPYYYDYPNDTGRAIDDTNGPGQKEAVKAFEEDNGYEVEGEGTGVPRASALSIMYDRYYAAFDTSLSVTLETADILGTGDTHSAEIPDDAFVDILAFPDIILPLVERYPADKSNIFKKWQSFVEADVDPNAFTLRVTRIGFTDRLADSPPCIRVEIAVSHAVEIPRFTEIEKTDGKPRRLFFDLENALLAVPAGSANPLNVNKGELIRVRYSQNTENRVRVVFDVTEQADYTARIAEGEGNSGFIVDIGRSTNVKLQSATSSQETNESGAAIDKIQFEFDDEIPESNTVFRMEGDEETGYRYVVGLEGVALAEDSDIKNWDKNGDRYTRELTGMRYTEKIVCNTGNGDVLSSVEILLKGQFEATHYETGNDEAFRLNVKIGEPPPIQLSNIIDGDHSNEAPPYWRVVCIFNEPIDVNRFDIAEEGKGTDDHVFSFELDRIELSSDSPLLQWAGRRDELNNDFIKSIQYSHDDEAKTLAVRMNVSKEATIKKGSTRSDGVSERVYFDIYTQRATAVMSVDTDTYADGIPIIPTESRVEGGKVKRRIDVQIEVKQGETPLSDVSLTVTVDRGSAFQFQQPQPTDENGKTSIRVETRESGEAVFSIDCDDYDIQAEDFTVDFTEAWYESGFLVTAYHFCHESDFSGPLVDAEGLNEQHRSDFLYDGTGVCMQGTGLTESNGYIHITNPQNLSWTGHYDEIDNQDDAVFAYGAGGAYNEIEEGTSIAVDPAVIPPNHRVDIQRVGERRADDTGGAIDDYHIDVFMGGGRRAINNWNQQGGNITNARVRYLGQ